MQNQCLKICLKTAVFQGRLNLLRVSSAYLSSRSPKVTVTDDGQTIVCHHPETKHPYEDTLPYTSKSDSIYKLSKQNLSENLYINQKVASVEDLQALTFTHKWVWTRKRFDGLQMKPDHPRKGV